MQTTVHWFIGCIPPWEVVVLHIGVIDWHQCVSPPPGRNITIYNLLPRQHHCRRESNTLICCLGNAYIKYLPEGVKFTYFWLNCTHIYKSQSHNIGLWILQLTGSLIQYGWINSLFWPADRVWSTPWFLGPVLLVWMHVLQVRQPHLFFFFLMIHTERMVMIMIMAAMNTTPATATEVAKMVAVGCEVVIAAWNKVQHG